MLKVITWNLKNIGQSKLGNQIDPLLTANGLGNNALDYMMKVVMGRPIWNGINGNLPADLFIVIELKTGGIAKGNAANGTSIPTMNMLRNAMNAAANLAGIQAQYTYANVPPLITGRHECVGIIYNTVTLTLGASGVGRNAGLGTFLLPRSPFWATFTYAGNPINIIGIHAPPPKGSVASYYVNPIKFCNLLQTVTAINVAPPAAAILTGDFNCNPTSFYVTYPPANGYNPVNVTPFAGLINYAYMLPNNAQLTSVRKKVNNAIPAPGNYLKDAYDNIIYRPAATVPLAGHALNLIGNAPAVLYQNNLRRLVSNFWKVSDHLPVMIVMP